MIPLPLKFVGVKFSLLAGPVMFTRKESLTVDIVNACLLSVSIKVSYCSCTIIVPFVRCIELNLMLSGFFSKLTEGAAQLTI